MMVPRLSASVLLSLTEKALKRVESKLRSAVATRAHSHHRSRSAEVRKPKSRENCSAQMRSSTAKSSMGSRRKQPKTPTLRSIDGLDFDRQHDILRPTSAVFDYLRPIDGLVRPHTEYSGKGRPRASQVLIDRMNLKLVKKHKSKAKRKENDEPVYDNSNEDLDIVLRHLRQRVQKMKVGHSQTNTKQMMTEFSGFGSKVLRKGNTRPVSSPDSSAKELVNMIELIDARLSTSESLAALKEIGISYEPRTAAGKKNATAAALAAGGLKLGSNDAVDTAVEEN
jgi:hypothetical protein